MPFVDIDRGDPADLCGSLTGTRETFFGMVAGDLVDTRKVTTPMLVMGGTGDEVYSVRDVRRTAHAYQTLPAAVTIESWLGRHGL